MRRIKEPTKAPWSKDKIDFQKDKWRAVLYNSWRWRKLAKAEIKQEPCCANCLKHGLVVTENLQRDHVNGFNNEDEFWNGPRQTLCKPCNIRKAGGSRSKPKI